jgi:hypothetical protein
MAFDLMLERLPASEEPFPLPDIRQETCDFSSVRILASVDIEGHFSVRCSLMGELLYPGDLSSWYNPHLRHCSPPLIAGAPWCGDRDRCWGPHESWVSYSKEFTNRAQSLEVATTVLLKIVYEGGYVSSSW